MSESNFRKLVRNIEKTGLYEPIVVRPHPEKRDCFEIINGHHRVKALEKIGRKEADCVVWNVDDQQTEILLSTLNRLGGVDSPSKKIALLRELTQRIASKDLAKLLPQTAKQIERLINLKLSIKPPQINADSFAIPLVFFVTKPQQEIIEKAIDSATQAPNFMLGVKLKPHRRAAALTEIANQFLKEKICLTEANYQKNNAK